MLRVVIGAYPHNAASSPRRQIFILVSPL